MRKVKAGRRSLKQAQPQAQPEPEPEPEPVLPGCPGKQDSALQALFEPPQGAIEHGSSGTSTLELGPAVGSCSMQTGLASLGLTTRDFPLQLVFADKSQSMASSEGTLAALRMSMERALEPSEGSCLLVLLAGPGDTQLRFSRAGESSDREPLRVELGCSTWFNEPVWLVLLALAPLAEKIVSSAAYHAATAAAGRTSTVLKPPISVVCVTDGMDNRSAKRLQTLPELSDAVAQIVGPQSKQSLYMPMGNWSMHDQVLASRQPRVPVLLLWVALGDHTKALVDQASPGRVTVVDAGRTKARPKNFVVFDESGQMTLSAQGPAETGVPSVGTGVIYRSNAATVTCVHGRTLTLLLHDGTETKGISIKSIKIPKPKESEAPPSRTPDHALALLYAVLDDPVEVIAHHVDLETGVVGLEAGAAVATEDILARLATYRTDRPGASLLGVEELQRAWAATGLQEARMQVRIAPIGTDFVKHLLAAVGAACGVGFADEGESADAASWMVDALDDLLADTAAIVSTRPASHLCPCGAKWGRVHRVSAPRRALLDYLLCTKLVVTAVKQPEKDNLHGTGFASYRAAAGTRPALLVARSSLCSMEEPLRVCQAVCGDSGTTAGKSHYAWMIGMSVVLRESFEPCWLEPKDALVQPAIVTCVRGEQFELLCLPPAPAVLWKSSAFLEAGTAARTFLEAGTAARTAVRCRAAAGSERHGVTLSQVVVQHMGAPPACAVVSLAEYAAVAPSFLPALLSAIGAACVARAPSGFVGVEATHATTLMLTALEQLSGEGRTNSHARAEDDVMEEPNSASELTTGRLHRVSAPRHAMLRQLTVAGVLTEHVEARQGAHGLPVASYELRDCARAAAAVAQTALCAMEEPLSACEAVYSRYRSLVDRSGTDTDDLAGFRFLRSPPAEHFTPFRTFPGEWDALAARAATSATAMPGRHGIMHHRPHVSSYGIIKPLSSRGEFAARCRSVLSRRPV